MIVLILHASDIVWFGEDYPDQQMTLPRTPSHLPNSFVSKTRRAGARKARIRVSNSSLCLSVWLRAWHIVGGKKIFVELTSAKGNCVIIGEEMRLHYSVPSLWLDFGIWHPILKCVRVVPFQIIGTYLYGVLHFICLLLIQYGKGTESPTPVALLLSPVLIFSPFILLISPPL